MSTSTKLRPFADAAEHYKAAGWAPIPILGGGKGKTSKYLTGSVTGHEGVDLDGDRLKLAIEKLGHCVIATRAPVDDGFWTIGIDCDHYGDKTGGETLAKWETEFEEPLPPTYVSTSREDGISGIRWFKVPVGWRGLANHPSVELVQRWHRQAVMAPSLHETRKVPYRWFAQSDRLPPMLKATEIGIEIPLVADLPWLPDAYLEGLRDDRPVTHGSVEIEDEDVRRLRTEGEPCQAVWKALEDYEHRTKVEGKACHDSMCAVQMRLLRLGEQEHQGVDAAMSALYDQFETDRGDQRDTATEFSDSQHTAVEKVLANPTPEDRRGCCTPLVPVKTIDYWLGVHKGAVVTVVADNAPHVPADVLAKWLG